MTEVWQLDVTGNWSRIEPQIGPDGLYVVDAKGHIVPAYYDRDKDQVFEALRPPKDRDVVEVTAANHQEVRRQNRAKGKTVTEAQAFDADAVTERWLKCKSAISNLTADCKRRVKIIEAEQARLEGLMREFLDAHKMNSAPCKSGTFFKTMSVKPAATDWTVLYEWIKKHDAFHFLHKRISSEAVKDYMEEHKDDTEGGLPPGLSVIKDYDIIVRTGKEK